MRIITDSSALFTPAEGKEMGIPVILACTVIDGKVYKDYEDISCEELLAKIGQGVIATTSQASIGDVLDVFAESREELLFLPIGDGLSGAYQNAIGAKNMLEDADYIHIMDTRTLGGPQRYLVRLAVSLREKGYTIEKIETELQKRIETSVSFVIPEDFEFLRRSGRLTPIAAKLGGILKIVPVLTQTEDMQRIELFSIKRSKTKALDAIAAHLQRLQMNESCLITIAHAGAEEAAKKAASHLKKTFDKAEFEILQLSPSLISHGGPGSVVIQAIRK